MIVVQKVPSPAIDVIGPNGFIYKDLNDLTLWKLLIEIAKNRVDGFWFINDDGEKEFISDIGEMNWPKRFRQDLPLIFELQNIQLNVKLSENEV